MFAFAVVVGNSSTLIFPHFTSDHEQRIARENSANIRQQWVAPASVPTLPVRGQEAGGWVAASFCSSGVLQWCCHERWNYSEGVSWRSRDLLIPDVSLSAERHCSAAFFESGRPSSAGRLFLHQLWHISQKQAESLVLQKWTFLATWVRLHFQKSSQSAYCRSSHWISKKFALLYIVTLVCIASSHKEGLIEIRGTMMTVTFLRQ